MKAIVVDDNTTYAETLAEEIGGNSVSLLSGENLSEINEVKDALEHQIHEMKEGEASGALQVLVNRELKLPDRKRQEELGHTLCQQVTWQYVDVPFTLYSFQQVPENGEMSFVRLPFAPEDIPSEIDDEELVDRKIRAFLNHFARVHRKVQHGLGEATSTPVNVVRLLNGAVQAGAVQSTEQWIEFDDFLEDEAFQSTGESTVDLLTEDIARLVELYSAKAEIQNIPEKNQGGQDDEKVVVVIDDEVNEEGQSLWARSLNIIFKKKGFRFLAKRPSEVQQEVTVLRSIGADMVLLDIDFSQDPDYEGQREFGGLDLLSVIQETLPHVPVVMMSIYDQIGLYEQCRQRGCYDYLTKAWGTYAKHRTEESEEKWFEKWRKAIEVPLRYEPFFKDVDLHEKQEIVPPTSIENLRTALRDIGNPTIRTARTLAGFFENFVFSYLTYRGVEAGGLSDALHTNVIEKSEQGLFEVGDPLRVMRNNIFHRGRYLNERLDTFLFITLLRVFVVRIIKPSRLGNLSWLSPIIEDLYLEINNCEFDADKSLFEKHEYIWSQANDRYLRDRTEALENLTGKRILEPQEFSNHLRLFIKSLTALYPEAAINRVVDVSKLGDFEPIGSLVGEVIIPESSARIGLKRGYEALAPIYWLIQSRDNCSALMDSKSNHDYEKRLRWLLAVRWWVWYFDEVLQRPNEVLFKKALEDRGLDRSDVLRSPNEALVGDFVRRNQDRFISAYCLLISMALVGDYIIERKEEIRKEEKRVKDKIDGKENEFEKVMDEKNESIVCREDKKGEIRDTLDEKQEKYFQSTDRITFAGERFEEWVEDKKTEIEELSEEIDNLKKKRRQLKYEFKSEIDQLNEKTRELQEARRRTEDEVEKPLRMRSMDGVDVLERRLKRKMRVLDQVFDKRLPNRSEWLKRVRKIASSGEERETSVYEEVEACVHEIRRILN